MGTEWIAGLAGIIGALGAVLIQGLLAHFGGTSERNRELLLSAHQALIEATAASAAGDRAALQGVIAAKQRVMYFAPPEVVHALAEFARTSQIFANDDAAAAFVALLRAMRKSLDLPEVEDRDLFRVLVGVDQLDERH